jgi:predicted ATP-dependent endonuclease of OLD family
VYLHADLQRQLIGLLRDFDADIVLATHSTEIMGEAEPADLVLIDKRNRAGERIKNVEKLQSALASVGSIHNITLSRLARSRRILFVEGEWDYKLMRMFARQFGLHSLELVSKIGSASNQALTLEVV